jgi:kynureninase
MSQTAADWKEFDYLKKHKENVDVSSEGPSLGKLVYVMGRFNAINFLTKGLRSKSQNLNLYFSGIVESLSCNRSFPVVLHVTAHTRTDHSSLYHAHACIMVI